MQVNLWNKWPKFPDDCCLFLNCHAIKGDTSFNSVCSSVDFDEVFPTSPDFNDMFQQGAKDLEVSLFFLIVSYMVYSEGWLNFFLMTTTLATTQN